MTWLERFGLERNGTTVRREIVAGATTFAAMSYIIFVQPTVLAVAGMDFGAVMTATCVASAVATLLMGLLANYPIALAPAMGHNFYFVYGVCLALGVPWQVALGANCVAGLAFVVLSAVGLREHIIDVLPASLKHAIGAGIGLLIAFVGLQWGGVVGANRGTLVGLGHLTSAPVLVTLGGLLQLFALHARRVPGAVLITMLTSALVSVSIGLLPFKGVLSLPPSVRPTLLQLDLAGALEPAMLEAFFLFFFLALFDTVGTLVAVADRAGLLRDGSLPRARRALLSDSIGIVQGTLWGTSTITSYVESAAGVAEGGRTGLANLVTAALFLLALFFGPLAETVGGGVLVGSTRLQPVVAPPLILIGAFMMSGAAQIDWRDPGEALPAFLCIAMMPLSFSIADGIGFGLLAHCAVRVAQGRSRELNGLLAAAVLLFALRFALRQ
jgi:AGZA family xanthine/uracil permease-like MFS transporter